MGFPDIARERITLSRYVEGAGNIGHHYEPWRHVWAAVEDQGAGRYRFRLWYEPDLRARADLEPAMHLTYRGVELVVDDISETIRHTEVQVAAHREIIEDIDHLAT